MPTPENLDGETAGRIVAGVVTAAGAVWAFFRGLLPVLKRRSLPPEARPSLSIAPPTGGGAAHHPSEMIEIRERLRLEGERALERRISEAVQAIAVDQADRIVRELAAAMVRELRKAIRQKPPDAAGDVQVLEVTADNLSDSLATLETLTLRLEAIIRRLEERDPMSTEAVREILDRKRSKPGAFQPEDTPDGSRAFADEKPEVRTDPQAGKWTHRGDTEGGRK